MRGVRKKRSIQHSRIMLSKSNLRLAVKQQIKRMTADDKEHASQQILRLLEVHPQFQRAHTVMLFYSLPDEVNTHGFIQKWATQKRILLPRVEGDHIIPCEYSEDKRTKGAYGIMEPERIPALASNVNLIVVPGVAFDYSGNRLGRGKGYYDRFLSQESWRSVPKIGICFPCQLLECVPTDSHDIRMDDVIGTFESR